MATSLEEVCQDEEFKAVKACLTILGDLDPAAALRVLEYINHVSVTRSEVKPTNVCNCALCRREAAESL